MLWRFLPMLWPKGERELKARVVLAVLLVLAGKGIGFIGPYALKLAVDRMSAHAAFAVVAGLILAYAGARFGGVFPALGFGHEEPDEKGEQRG